MIKSIILKVLKHNEISIGLIIGILGTKLLLNISWPVAIICGFFGTGLFCWLDEMRMSLFMIIELYRFRRRLLGFKKELVTATLKSREDRGYVDNIVESEDNYEV